MEHDKNPQLPEDDRWLDGILNTPEAPSELGPDEHALTAAEFARMEDIEVEKIMQETRSEDWDAMLQAMPDILEEDEAPQAFFGFSRPEELEEASAAAAAPLIPEQTPEAQPADAVKPTPEAAAAPDKSLLEMGDETLMRWAVAPLAQEIPDQAAQEQPAAESEQPAQPEKSLLEMGDETLMRWASGGPDFDAGQTRRYDTDANWVLPEQVQLSAQPETPNEPEDPAEEETEDTQVEEEKQEQQPKRRPVGKKGYGLFGLPHLAASLIWLAIIIGLGVTLGRTVWICMAELLAFGKPDISVTITITDEDMAAEDTLERIAEKLKNAGLIDHPQLFLLYAKGTHAEEEITAGTYTLKGTDDYMALVNSMNTYSSSRETVEVMIPEGYTCAQIFALLEEKGVCTAAELGEYAANGELKDYWFLEGVERGTRYCLEGYLFPDTYEFYVGDDPGRVITKMLGDSVGGFDIRFTDIMEEKLVELNERLATMMKKNGYGQDYIDSHPITIREVVIIASMIEKETTGSDRYDISSVIYNRLTNAGEYPYLNIDATLIYAVGGKIDPETGESIPLTEADKKLDSPYNTYLYKGLPPGPISNPGVYSLLAALDPNETDYYYYVYNPAIGAHKFSETYREHQNYINSME